MAKLAERLLPTVYKGRAIAGKLGFRPHAVALLFEYNRDTTGKPLGQPDIVPITEADGQPPRCEWKKGDDVPFGNTPGNVLVVGPCTPTPALVDMLRRPLDANTARVLLVTGPRHPNGERYQILDVDQQRTLRIMITAQKADDGLGGYA